MLHFVNYSIVAVVLLLFCHNAWALDQPSQNEFDAEVEDEIITDHELEEEMTSSFDLNFAEDRLQDERREQDEDELQDSDLIDIEKMLLDVVHAEEEKIKEEDDDNEEEEDGDLEEYEEQHFMRKRDTRKFVMEDLLRDIRMNYLSEEEGAGLRRSGCPLFVKPTSHATTKCGSIKTMLGNVKWCHIQCSTGYKLKHAYPQYELCGKSTKYRWTYELRGLDKGTERCIVGSTNVTSTSCTTKECFATAAYYMNKIDFNVNPCHDFYDFACGRWLKETPIPHSKSKYLTYTEIRDRVTYNVADLLALPYHSGQCQAVKKAKIAYKSCMNTPLIEELDANPLMSFLKGKMAWPIIDPTWKNSNLFIEKTMAFLRGKYNNQVLLKVMVRKYNGKFVLQTWKGKMALPYPYYMEERYSDRLDAYYALMRDVALMLGGDRETVEADVAAVREFEKELAHHKAYDWDYFTEQTIAQMQINIPGFMNWYKLFKLMIYSHPITHNTKLQVWNVNYLRNLLVLIKKAGKRTIQNYMMWRFVKHRVKNLSLRFRKRYQEYEEVMVGKRALPSRKYKCAEHMLFTMKGATSKLFIDKYFSPAKKTAALVLFDNIRKGFISLLSSEVTWMDNKTRNYAKKKALAIKANIGYNAHIYKNVTYLDGQVAKLVVKDWDYFGNTLRTLTSIAQDKFALIGTKYNPVTEGFSQRPTMVNAFYSPQHNRITLPAGEMQYPFYWGDKYPWFFQFGAVGTILGHELTHGFDNTGRMYDLNGNMNNWWSPGSLFEFKKRTQCMVNQYSNYLYETAGMHLNGQNTLGENIADNGGIRESFKGYHLWLKSKGLTGEQIEPSTGFTNDQMFFVGFANVRCGEYTRAGAVHEVASDVHSPGRFRVIGSLQNFAKFSETFHCAAGSPMNPAKKCIIW